MPAYSSALSYIVINIDPVFNIGPLAIHWYGVAYVVGISVGLWAILRYAHQLGLDSEIVYKVFWWAALGGLIGGRLYFVIQQPNLVNDYLKNPINIIAVWNGGMAFFGAIFLGIATVAFVAWRRRLPIWLALDIAVFFAAVGQIFGRFGNLVNGDILGYQAGNLSTAPDTCINAPCVGIVSAPHILPWATVYVNPHSFAPLLTPFQPAAAYEMLMNIILLAILFPLLLRLPRIKMGLVSLVYLTGYAISQIIIFFFRGSEPITPFLGITLFKQAQWTGIIVLVLLIPYYFLIRRTSRPWTREEAEAVNAFQAQAALARAGAGGGAAVKEHEHETAKEQHEGHQHKEREGEEAPAAATGDPETANEVEHDAKAHHAETAAALAEHGLMPEYNEVIAAELRTEGIEVEPATPEGDTRNGVEGESRPATRPRAKPRTRTGGTSAGSSRRGRSSERKSSEE